MFENRASLSKTPEHELALDCLREGINAAHPESIINTRVELNGETIAINGSQYNLSDYDRVFILGGGNAAGHVAAALEQQLNGRIDDGVVVTDDPVSLSTINCVEGSHPIPDANATDGTQRILELASTATKDDLVIAIITGGGSALLPAPTGSLELSDLQAVTEALLTSGATINEINSVRKHLSDIKGGKLAQEATSATVIGLVFSDVGGNDLGSVASGPVSPDDTTYDDALDIIDFYDVDVPNTVYKHLQQGSKGVLRESPNSKSEIFENVFTHILADNFTALSAASSVASERGYEPVILSSHIRGEASEAAKVHTGIAEEVVATGNPVDPPAVLLSGGETTVTVDGEGNGGPNQEFALSAALELDVPSTVIGAVDTDGIDGNVDVAGALIDATTIGNRSTAQHALADNNAYEFLNTAEALLRTGPTGTNVNDLRVIVIGD